MMVPATRCGRPGRGLVPSLWGVLLTGCAVSGVTESPTLSTGSDGSVGGDVRDEGDVIRDDTPPAITSPPQTKPSAGDASSAAPTERDADASVPTVRDADSSVPTVRDASGSEPAPLDAGNAGPTVGDASGESPLRDATVAQLDAGSPVNACAPREPVATCDPVRNMGCLPLTQCDIDTAASTPTGRCVFFQAAAPGACMVTFLSETCEAQSTCVASACRKLCYCDSDCPTGQCCNDLSGPGPKGAFKLCRPC